MPFSKFIRTIKEFEAQKDKALLECVKEFEPEIIDMATSQLWEGNLATGNPIEPSYHPITIELKNISGLPSDRVTLFQTGDFHDSFFIAYGSNSFSIGATDEKTEKLERKYGSNIFGLDDKNLQETIDMIKPQFLEKFRKALNE